MSSLETDLTEARKAAIDDLRDYLDQSGNDVGYTHEHVEAADRILLDFQHQVVALNPVTREGFDALLTPVVEALNTLNDQTDGNLIETDQRELLCAFFNLASALTNVSLPGDDVTEATREW